MFQLKESGSDKYVTVNSNGWCTLGDEKEALCFSSHSIDGNVILKIEKDQQWKNSFVGLSMNGAVGIYKKDKRKVFQFESDTLICKSKGKYMEHKLSYKKNLSLYCWNDYTQCSLMKEPLGYDVDEYIEYKTKDGWKEGFIKTVNKDGTYNILRSDETIGKSWKRKNLRLPTEYAHSETTTTTTTTYESKVGIPNFNGLWTLQKADNLEAMLKAKKFNFFLRKILIRAPMSMKQQITHNDEHWAIMAQGRNPIKNEWTMGKDFVMKGIDGSKNNANAVYNGAAQEVTMKLISDDKSRNGEETKYTRTMTDDGIMRCEVVSLGVTMMQYWKRD